MATIEIGSDFIRMTLEMRNGDSWMIAQYPELSPGSDFGLGVIASCCGTWYPVNVTRAEVKELAEALQDFLKVTEGVTDSSGTTLSRQ